MTPTDFQRLPSRELTPRPYSQDPYASLPVNDKASFGTNSSASASGGASDSSASDSPVRMNRVRVPNYVREGRGRVEQISRGVISGDNTFKVSRHPEANI